MRRGRGARGGLAAFAATVALVVALAGCNRVDQGPPELEDGGGTASLPADAGPPPAAEQGAAEPPVAASEAGTRGAASGRSPERAGEGRNSGGEPATPAAAAAAAETGPRDAAHRVVEALAARDVGRLAELADPERGVAFSPHAYVDEPVVLSPGELERAWSSGERRVWGHEDGTGEPIELTFRQYLDRWVYDADFAAAPVVAVDRRVGTGNTVSNLASAFPGARFVEYHFPGSDPAYEGMDWRSLRLVFVERDGRWRWVAAVHDEWTI